MSDAALSVLVLAWDEAAPTLRTVVAAAPAVGSLLVLLPPQPPAPPAAPAPPPAPPEAEAPAPATAASPTATTPAPPVSTAAPAAAPAPAAPALPLAPPPRALVPAAAPAAAAPPPAPLVANLLATTATPPPVASPAVRLLRLADNPLALLARTGRFRVPAAPYLGATPAPLAQAAPDASATLPTPALASQQEPAAQAAASAMPPRPTAAAPTPPLGPAEAAEPVDPTAAPALLPTSIEAPQPAEEATSSEAPAAAPGPATGENVPTLADAAFRAEEILDPDPMQELQAAPLEAPAATPADSPVLRDALPTAHGPFGLRIPERLPVLADPTPPPTRAPEPEEDELLPEDPALVAAPYSAPDLNTQVIRYARQAVQTALAEGPFSTIYAPAWPTWLAALELRQRSGRPLVLHLTALAAGRQPADTAAGWPAELQRQALRQAEVVLVETYSLARRLRRELGLATNAVRVVPTGDAAAIARALRRARRA